MSSIINNYATAILGCALSIEDTKEVLRDLLFVQDFFDNFQIQIRKSIFGKSTAIKTKLKLWHEIHKGLHEHIGGIRPEADAAIKLLIGNKRLHMLAVIVERVRIRLLVRQNITECIITLPQLTSAEYKEKLIKALNDQVKNQMQPKFMTDNSLVAGFAISVGSKFLDLSFKAKMQKLKTNIIKYQ